MSQRPESSDAPQDNGRGDLASLNRRILAASAASWFGRALMILAKLGLTAMLFSVLSPQTLGWWYLMIQSGAIVGMLDLGMQSTIARRVALIRGSYAGGLGEPLPASVGRKLATMRAMSRSVFQAVAVLVLVVTFAMGLAMTQAIEPTMKGWILAAWLAMSFAWACNALAMDVTATLRGLGHVGWDSAILTATGLGVSLVQAALLLCLPLLLDRPPTLLELALAVLGGAITYRIWIARAIGSMEPDLINHSGSWDANIFRELRPLAFNTWMTNLGGYLTMKTDEIFIAIAMGAHRIPGYSATALILINIESLAMALASSSDVFISQRWQAGDRDTVWLILVRNIRLAMCVVLTGTACFWFCAEELLSLWLGPGWFIGRSTLLVMSLNVIFAVHLVVIATASRATEDEPFARCSMISGVLNLVFTGLLVGEFGLLGVATGTLAAQTLTSNWYVVYRGLKRLEISLATHVTQVILPSLAVLGGTILALSVGQELAGGQSALTYVTTCFVISAACLALAIETLGLRSLHIEPNDDHLPTT